MEPEPSEDAGEEPESLVEKIVERMRGTGVGTEDPNIIGDAGPTDVPPGRDPDFVWPPPDILEEGVAAVEDPEAPG